MAFVHVELNACVKRFLLENKMTKYYANHVILKLELVYKKSFYSFKNPYGESDVFSIIATQFPTLCRKSRTDKYVSHLCKQPFMR